MILRILHIDDEPETLKDVAKVVNGEKLGDYELQIVSAGNFDEGMKLLQDDDFDLIILDLCIGNAAKESDKVGEKVFEMIKDRAFIPVVFFTGLPEYVRHLESDIVRVVGKKEGYDALFKQIDFVLATNFLQLKGEINGLIRDGLKSYFWNFVHPNKKMIDEIQKDKVSLKHILIRRLGKILAADALQQAAQDENLKDGFIHPMEFYIYPPLTGEFETGDILLCKKTGQYYVILTPACDLILRVDDKKKTSERKAERILLLKASEFKSSTEYKKYEELKEAHNKVSAEVVALEGKKDEALKTKLSQSNNQLSNQIAKLKGLMKPSPNNERYFFLPKTPFLPALLLDFQHKITVSYEELEKYTDVIATLDDPFSQSLQAGFSRYYNRIGFPDLDIEYSFERL